MTVQPGVTVEFMNGIPGRPDLMLPWRAIPRSSPDFHWLECVGDGVDLSPEFSLMVYWLDDPRSGISLEVCLPELGPDAPIWEKLVEYARTVHQHLQALR